MAQFQGVDSTAIGSIGAPMYGHMYADAVGSPVTITVSSANTFYGVTGFTEGVVSGLTTDTSDATADHFIVPAGGAGDYFVEFSCSGTPNDASDNVEWSVFVGESQQVSITSHVVRTSNMTAGRTACGILSLSDADEVSLRAQNTTDTGNITYQTVQLSMHRLST